MTVRRPLSDAELSPRAAAVFDDIRATRGSDFVNNIWRVLAMDDALLEKVWAEVRTTMAETRALDPLTKEMIYLAVSAANGCEYCVHSHTAAARARGMTDAMHAELLDVIALAARTNMLAEALKVPVDPEFQEGS